MRRSFAIPMVAAVLALSTTAAPSDETAQRRCCEVNCSVEKLENGIRCSLQSAGDGDLAAVRSCIRSCAEKQAMQGVRLTFEDVEGGIVVTQTADSADLVAALHAQADACAKGNCGFCTKGEGKAGCSKHGKSGHPCCKKPAIVS